MKSKKKVRILISVALVMVLLLSAGQVFAETNVNTDEAVITDEKDLLEESIPSYSLDELQETAVLYSRALTKLEKQEERGEITREQAVSQRTFLLGRTPSTMEELMAKQAAYAVLAKDIQLEMTRKEMELEEDKIQFNVLDAWFDILQAERNVDLTKTELDIAVTENRISSIRYQLGMTSEIEVKLAENALQEKQNKIERTNLQVKAAYETMNSLVGFNADARYNVYREELPELQIPEDVERHIRNVLNNSPDLWLLEKQVELAEWSLRFYTYNQETDPYSARAIDVETAELTLSQARKQLEDSLRNVSNGLNQMQLEQNDLYLNLQNAKENLDMTELRFEIGMATALDVKNASLAVKQLESGLKTYAQNFEKMLINYQKPWTVSASGGF